MCRVDIEAYENLVKMGFPKGGSAEALRQCNNDINVALQVSYKALLAYMYVHCLWSFEMLL